MSISSVFTILTERDNDKGLRCCHGCLNVEKLRLLAQRHRCWKRADNKKTLAILKYIYKMKYKLKILKTEKWINQVN